MKIHVIFSCTLILNVVMTLKTNTSLKKQFTEHSTVNDNKAFPYMAAILQKTAYLSSGALIDESWVLTGADSLYTIRESSRTLRVRLGTVNYKKGGYLTPIKFFEIHPYFDDSKPQFDVALIKLPHPVVMTPSLNPIKLQKRPTILAAMHFTVTSWPIYKQKKVYKHGVYNNLERALTVKYLHPSNRERCSEELDALVPDEDKALICLHPGIDSDPCQRDVGAPVVLNGVLWGIVSSWISEDCDIEPVLVTMVSNSNISSWIHSTIHGKRWRRKYIGNNNNLI
ncbi:unnamed protein product, partial [Brenthis ino]